MAEAFRATLIAFCALVLGIALLANDWPSAAGVAMILAMFVFAGRREADRPQGPYDLDPEALPPPKPNPLEQLLNVPLKWHALALGFLAVIFILSLWQYGGIDAGSIASGAMTIAFAILLVVGHLRRRAHRC